jgi:hypothetical protein
VKSDSKKPEDLGSLSTAEQKFHRTMQALYAAQKKDCTNSKRNCNDYYVAAKLPESQYIAFYAFLESKGWSKSTGIKFAIHQLLLSKNV